MRTLTYVCVLLSAPAFAQVHVEVVAPPPPRVQVVVPAPPRVHVEAPPPRVQVVVPAPPRVQVVAPPPPVVRFEAPPPLVTVQPGVQVVEDADEEVFFSAGYYWHRSPDGIWWRTHNHRGGWVVAPIRVVPGAVVHLHPGHYRHFHGGGGWKHERREVRREIRHERHERRHGR